MLYKGKRYRTIWADEKNPEVIKTIDQRKLPFEFEIVSLRTPGDTAEAIRNMTVRGAPLIGVTGAYGVYLSAIDAKKNFANENDRNNFIISSAEKIKSARPTAINLKWAVERTLSKVNKAEGIDKKIETAFRTVQILADEDAGMCQKIGKHGLKLIKELSERKHGDTVNILTHCNAGWLACIDYGTATSPVYKAHEEGLKVHVWIEETRPRNQGSSLTSFELSEHGIPNTVITDNAGGYVLQKRMADIVIVGSDRTTVHGDVCNKIGTYKTALAAKDNNIPFYAALPSSSIDWIIEDALNEIPIEERDVNEVKYISGKLNDEIVSILVTPENASAKNYAFDITPSRLVTALITERGICLPEKESISGLFPDKVNS